MSDDQELPGWTGETRADGAQVIGAIDGKNWIITTPGGRPVVTCPCCWQLMISARQAKMVCDQFYPPVVPS